ncbi:MAG: hypothetical protein KA802_12840 [Saprospiraceae bacterium]|nr:hypothetical protein [Saprospiraceae bacterium]MBP9189621.1 hypothetical protein [Chitinophagales bacterium]
MEDTINKFSPNIAFKAKLLTLNRYGLTDSSNIMQQVLNQRLKYYYNIEIKNFVFIEINHSQVYSYTTNEGLSETFYAVGCSYFLAYNLHEAKFYRLFGFDISDYSEFKETVSELKFQNFDLYSDLLNYLSDIYSTCQNKKKIYKCDCNCQDDSANGLKVY